MSSLMYWYGTFEFMIGAFLAVPATIYIHNRKEEFAYEVKFIYKFAKKYATKQVRQYKKGR